MELTEKDKMLIGKWIYKNGSFHKDEICERIEWLLKNKLKRITTDESGWDVLYIDPADNRHWELIFPKSEMQGGGPPTLMYISNEKVKQKYSDKK